MLANWSDLYRGKIKKGDDFTVLKPAIAIWVLTDTLFTHSTQFHHHFQAWDLANKELLSDHFSIHTLELGKWQHPTQLQGMDEWIYFLTQAGTWTELPNDLSSKVMRQAMNVLEQFSEKEESYQYYLSRVSAERNVRTQQNELKRALERSTVAEKERGSAVERESMERERATLAEKEQDRERERAVKLEQEKERLMQKLRNAGIDPS